MHEMTLAQNVVQIVEDAARRNGATRVAVVHVEIGGLSHVEPEALEFAFEAVARGGLAQGARLDIHRTAGVARCLACGETVRLERLGDPCPRCGDYQLQVTGGDEMRVRDIEIA
jgi:hydrogenase nickel incorporation protein HypA/HybF